MDKVHTSLDVEESMQEDDSELHTFHYILYTLILARA